MSQHDYNIANAGGAAVRSDINNALAAVQSLNSGSTAPTATKPFMPWYDTTTGALMMRNAGDTDWVSMAEAVGGLSLRNNIINGDMRVAQRGTTGALTTGYTYISVDRFAGIQGTTANGILARVAATGLDAFQFAAKIGRNAAATTTGPIVLRSALESLNSIPLQGKTVTFSFYAKAGANFSAASSNISVTVSTGTGTDQSLATMATWTGVSTPINTTTAITTSWVRYSYTGTIAASATQVGVSISHTPVGTAGADDNLYVTGVQLEVGPVATPFEQRPYGMELALCQRYYYRIDPGSVNETFGPAFCSTTTLAFGTVAFPVVMRTAPSALEQSGVASDYKIFTTGGSSTNCSAVPTIVGSTTDITGVVTFTFASGLVAGNGGLIGTGTTTGANAYLGFSAEL